MKIVVVVTPVANCIGISRNSIASIFSQKGYKYKPEDFTIRPESGNNFDTINAVIDRIT